MAALCNSCFWWLASPQGGPQRCVPPMSGMLPTQTFASARCSRQMKTFVGTDHHAFSWHCNGVCGARWRSFQQDGAEMCSFLRFVTANEPVCWLSMRSPHFHALARPISAPALWCRTAGCGGAAAPRQWQRLPDVPWQAINCLACKPGHLAPHRAPASALPGMQRRGCAARAALRIVLWKRV